MSDSPCVVSDCTRFVPTVDASNLLSVTLLLSTPLGETFLVDIVATTGDAIDDLLPFLEFFIADWTGNFRQVNGKDDLAGHNGRSIPIAFEWPALNGGLFGDLVIHNLAGGFGKLEPRGFAGLWTRELTLALFQ